MGYNYKTTNPTDTDFIMSSPTNLMQQGLQQVAAQDDEQIKSLDLFGNAIANVHHLPGQEDEVKAIQDAYHKQIDDVTNQILTDPANYQKHMPLIRGIQKDLSNNLQNGALAYYNTTADAFSEADKNMHQRVLGTPTKPGDITPEQYQAWRTYTLGNYSKRVQDAGGKAYNTNTGASVPLQSEDLYTNQDINKKVKEATDGIKANSSEWSKDQITGQWVYTNKGGNEAVEAARVANLAWNSLQSDPEVMGWARQGQKMGYLNGVTYPAGTKDADGKDISGQTIQPYSIDAKGNPVFNGQSMFAAPIMASVGRDAYRKTKSDTTTKANEYGVKTFEDKLTTQREVAMENLKHSNKVADEATAAAVKLETAKQEAAWKHAVGTSDKAETYKQVMDRVNGLGSTTVSTQKLKDSPDGSTTISPFAGLDHNPDGTKKPITSTEINAVLLPASAARMADINLQLKSGALPENQRALLQQQYANEEANHTWLSDMSNKAYTSSIGNLVKSGKYTARDLNLYYSGQKPEVVEAKKKILDGLKADLDHITNPTYAAASRTPGINPGQQYTDLPKARELLTQISNLNKQTDKMNQIGKDLNKGTSDWFEKNASETNIKLSGVGLSAPNKQLIYSQLKQNPQVDIRDLNTDNSGSAELVQNMLKKVIADGKNIEDYFDIKTINSPVKGLGTTVSIRAKDPKFAGESQDELKGVYAQDMLLTLPSSTLNAIGSNMKTNPKSDKEKNMGELMDNQAYSDLLSSLNHRFIPKNAEGYTGPVGTANYLDPETHHQLGITLVPHTSPHHPDATTYSIYVKNNDGINHTFTNPEHPTGEFASEESAVQALMGFDPSKK